MKDSDKNIRLAAVQKITDEVILKAIALKDSDEFIRLAAVQKITDEVVLKEVALKDSSWSVRECAVEKITDEAVWKEILIPCLTGKPNFPNNFTEVSFHDAGLHNSIKVNRNGVYLDFVHIPFSKIVDVKWQPILRPEIAIGGWVKIITPDNPFCPVREGSWFVMPGNAGERVKKMGKLYPEKFYGTQKLYPQDNCLWYNAGYVEEAKKKDEKVKNILDIIRHIIGLKD